ncbi:MAG: hypothetical protein VXY93_21050, partial [Pseudomonadota bacterium]|nr:hypothetical protein [Pseudomonadota bacterium]
GLDSDTVDGIQASSFLRSDASDTATGSIVFNGVTQYFRRNDTTNYTNAPLIVESYGGSSTTTGIGFHISGQLGRYLRMNSSGVLAWEGSTIWHAGNDGSGSGLDADTLDGINSGSFLRSDANDSASGLITLGNGVIITKASADQSTSQDSASIPSTSGAEIVKFQGGYTNGQYTTEFAKV